MFRYILCTIIALLCCACAAQAQTIEIMSNAMIVGDCASTIHNLRKDPSFVEDNPVMSGRPTNGTVLFWCGVSLGANEGLVRFLFPGDKRAQKIIWSVVGILEATRIEHNLRIGGIIRF